MAEDSPQQPQEPAAEFAIQKLYLKDVSFEAPNSPEIFLKEWKPETNVQLNTESRRLDEANHEVVLTLTVTTKSQDKTAYLVEVKQAGVFTAKGFDKDRLGHLLGAYCPTILLPYAREVISSLVLKGGFPDMIIAPINFDALYAQHLQQLKAREGEGAGGTAH